MTKKPIRLGFVALLTLFSISFTPSFVFANNVADGSQIPILLDQNGKVKVYQPSGVEGYVEIPKVDKRFDVNGDSITVVSADGEFSFTPYDQIFSDILLPESERAIETQDVIETNSEELIVSNKIKLSNVTSISKANIIYEIDLPDGGYLDFVSDAENNKNTSVIVYNSKGVALGGFYNPEAITENGDKIDAYFTIRDNKLMLKTSTPSLNVITINFGVTALDYYHFYSNSFWDTRQETHGHNLYLSIYTNAWAQWDFHTIAWEVLAARHRGDGVTFQGIFRPYFQGNEAGLYDQWYCHLLAVGHRQAWHIEPSRPNVGLPATISAHCNPY